MQKPTPPQERAYMPYWALNPFGDGTEEINVMVSGEGSPIKEDELDLEDPEVEQKFRQSPRGRLLAAVLGQETFDDFVESALEGDYDPFWSYGGGVSVDDMRLFAEIYGVPFDTVRVRLTDRPGEGLFLHGVRHHSKEEIAQARRPYEEALAQYKLDLAAWEHAWEKAIQEEALRRGAKYNGLK